MDLSKPLAPDEKVTVFVVHCGTLSDKNGGKDAVNGLAEPVCTRMTKKDAEEVADALNKAQEQVFYLKYCASNFFPMASGGKTELMDMAETVDAKTKWEKIFSPHRRKLYTVAELQIVEEEDAETLKKELKQQENKTK